ncbi:MAG TPA: endonuclease/exonuclease/phosphatase family protein [Nocardioidaceae bacterium]|nr:endonuclease/exonuclease/phosphatase family protein [Nocardioidaceae bacterium]
MPSARVMTYNILNGGERGAALHDVVREVDPDVLLVQETPKLPLLWRKGCRRLVQAWGMRLVTGGRTAGSNLIAVRRGIAVKSAGSVAFHDGSFAPRRGVAWAQLRIEGRLVGVVCTHFSLEAWRREREVERVLSVAAGLRGSVIVGGDLNERPVAPNWRRLVSAGYVDHGTKRWRTFPSDEPTKRIDALLVRGQAEVVHHGGPGVPDEMLVAGSDHRPVLAVLDF